MTNHSGTSPIKNPKLPQRILWRCKNRFPRIAWAFRWLRPSRRKERKHWRAKSTQEIFETIWEENNWGSPESRSGAGSTLKATEHLRAELSKVTTKLGIRTMLDAPCGDFNWMQHCQLGIDKYIGADIVPNMVSKLQLKYTSPSRSFIHLDITTDPLPQTDALFCRDLFLHLSNEHIHRILDNYIKSNSRYLIASTYLDTRVNFDNFTGGVRMINLCLPPYSLPEPLTYIVDRGEGPFERALGVWSREQVRAAQRGD